MSAAIGKLARICKRWGGELVILPTLEKLRQILSRGKSRSLYETPFDSFHGINWHHKKIFGVVGSMKTGVIIHEMGHIFANRYPPWSARGLNEYDWLGWEIALARQIGAYAEWSEQNSGYGIHWEDPVHPGDEYFDWGALTAKAEERLVAERVTHTTKIGLLDRGRPVAVR